MNTIKNEENVKNVINLIVNLFHVNKANPHPQDNQSFPRDADDAHAHKAPDHAVAVSKTITQHPAEPSSIVFSKHPAAPSSIVCSEHPAVVDNSNISEKSATQDHIVTSGHSAAAQSVVTPEQAVPPNTAPSINLLAVDAQAGPDNQVTLAQLNNQKLSENPSYDNTNFQQVHPQIESITRRYVDFNKADKSTRPSIKELANDDAKFNAFFPTANIDILKQKLYNKGSHKISYKKIRKYDPSMAPFSILQIQEDSASGKCVMYALGSAIGNGSFGSKVREAINLETREVIAVKIKFSGDERATNILANTTGMAPGFKIKCHNETAMLYDYKPEMVIHSELARATNKGFNKIYCFHKLGASDLWKFMIKNGEKLNYIDRVKICLLIIQEVEKIHSKNIIHSDLKIDNILVNWDNDASGAEWSSVDNLKVSIIDFGLAGKIGEERRIDVDRWPLMDRTLCPAFSDSMCPDVYKANPFFKGQLNEKNDIYTLASLVHTLISNLSSSDLNHLNRLAVNPNTRETSVGLWHLCNTWVQFIAINRGDIITHRNSLSDFKQVLMLLSNRWENSIEALRKGEATPAPRIEAASEARAMQEMQLEESEATSAHKKTHYSKRAGA